MVLVEGAGRADQAVVWLLSGSAAGAAAAIIPYQAPLSGGHIYIRNPTQSSSGP